MYTFSSKRGLVQARTNRWKKILLSVLAVSRAVSTRPQNGREIRYGRRRLNDKMPRYSMARYMQDRQKWREASGPVKLRPVWPANPQVTMETKRRRKTPPTSSNEVTTPEPDAAPIPECNIGNQMLQMMGWTVGTGLGPTGAGIKVPLQATIRPKRQGLGYDMDDDDS